MSGRGGRQSWASLVSEIQSSQGLQGLIWRRLEAWLPYPDGNPGMGRKQWGHGPGLQIQKETIEVDSTAPLILLVFVP